MKLGRKKITVPLRFSKRIGKRPMLFMGLFAIVGALIIILSHAATPTASLEAESGTISGGSASQITGDTAASGSGYVRFKATGSGGPTSLGEQWNASNTGIAGDSLTSASLTTVLPTGGTEYSTSGTAANPVVISKKNFVGIGGDNYTPAVTINGDYITLKDCQIILGGVGAIGIRITATSSHITIDHCTLTAPTGQSFYEPILIDGGADSIVVSHNDISRGENLLTTYGTNVSITNNYMHDVEYLSNPSTGDADAIEVYGGSNISITSNYISEVNNNESPVNVAPWDSSNPSVINLSVTDNFLDGGSEAILVDLQTSNGAIQNTRILRNIMGGHQSFQGVLTGYIYRPLSNNDGRAVVESEAQLSTNQNAILWPTSGANANYWGHSGDLVPNKNGQVVIP